MHESHHSKTGNRMLADRVQAVTGASPLKCYQCGRCSAGCLQNQPGEMDVSPTRIMRLLQLESAFADDAAQAEQYATEALSADTCWLCAGCQACTTRCPQGVDIAGTMDVLREESLRLKKASRSRRAKDIQALHRTFLKSAVKRGRVHELSMILKYKLATGHLLADAMLGPAMMKRGKLHILPGESPDTSRVRAAIDQLKHNDHSQEGGQ